MLPNAPCSFEIDTIETVQRWGIPINFMGVKCDFMVYDVSFLWNGFMVCLTQQIGSISIWYVVYHYNFTGPCHIMWIIVQNLWYWNEPGLIW